jgi:hypothetical protein
LREEKAVSVAEKKPEPPTNKIIAIRILIL